MGYNEEIETLKEIEKIGSQKVMQEFEEYYQKFEEAHDIARAYSNEIEKQFGYKPTYKIRKQK